MPTATFRSINPQTATAFGPEFVESSKEEVEKKILAAHAIRREFADLEPKRRAALLREIADAIESRREKLVAIAPLETGLPVARITSEVTRTVVQIRAFATMVETGIHYNATIDLPDPDFQPAPRPDIRKFNQSLGVVAIFAASNFPLAFSVMGGDSASALAAGCPVIVKAHPSHPQTSEIVFQAVQSALRSLGLPGEIFSIAHGQNPELTHWLATADHVTAIGFTGSGLVGKLLVKLASERKVPIPVFAEMGSLNPVFITTNAITERASAIAKGAAESVLMGSGQFCTKPGLFFIPSDSTGDVFIAEFTIQLSQSQAAPLLNPGIRDRYKKSMAELESAPVISVLHGLPGSDTGLSVQPAVIVVNAEEFARMPQLSEEHFGPTSVIVRASVASYSAIAASIEGQLTTTIHAGADEQDDLSKLISELAQISGRVIWNGFPTGVAVTAAMNHGGPWPASSTNTTSVGIDATYRFLRPVSYQGFPDAYLPPALQASNPWKIERVTNGVRG